MVIQNFRFEFPADPKCTPIPIGAQLLRASFLSEETFPHRSKIPKP